MSAPRHRRPGRGLSLRRAAALAAVAYVALGAVWFFAWWATGGPPTGAARQAWGAALLLPVAACELLVARRLGDGPLWRYAAAQIAVLLLATAMAWAGTAAGVFLAWFVVWTAVEPRVIGFVGFWWGARRVAWPWLRRAWTASA